MLDLAANRRASSRSCAASCGTLAKVLALVCWLAPGARGLPQKPGTDAREPTCQCPETRAGQQKLPRVTTTVVVHGETKDDYLPETVTVGTLDGATLEQAPLSATVVTRDLLNDQVARLLSDVVKNDASIGEDYAPVGYYGDFEIRGFPIDLATGLEINGMTIAGEQDVPLENKESVEFLKGHRRRGERRGLGRRADRLRDQAAGCDQGRRSGHRSSRNRLRRGRSWPSLRQPQAGGRARESGRRTESRAT